MSDKIQQILYMQEKIRFYIAEMKLFGRLK